MLSQQPLVNRDTINVVDEDTSVQRLLPQQPMVSRDIIYGGNVLEGSPGKASDREREETTASRHGS